MFSNGVRGTGPWQFSGGAGVFGPQGRALRRAPAAEEASMCAGLDHDESVATRAQLPMLADCVRPSG